MNQHLRKCLFIIIGIFLISGCAGHDRILFITKTNVGIDVSRSPLPTAEVTIARREVAILPTYQDTEAGKSVEKTLPLLGSFALTGGLLNPNISSVFSGGSAAVALAEEPSPKTPSPKTPPPKTPPPKIPPNNYKEPHMCGDSVDKNSHSIVLTQYPDTRNRFEKAWDWVTRKTEDEIRKIHQGEIAPFYFATDSSFGVKVAWDGTGGPYPTNLKIGYNRAEFAYPPILISKCGSGQKELDRTAYWEVKVPSFFASVDNKNRFNKVLTDPDTGVSHIQVFATGKAATAWASRSSIKETTFKLMAPDAAKIENPEKPEDEKESAPKK